MKAVHAVVAAGALALALIWGAGAAAASAPGVTVTPSSRLSGGDTVSVSGWGLTPRAGVQVIQCDVFTGDPEQDCWPRVTTTSGAHGGVHVQVSLLDPVYRTMPEGDPKPIYCRADSCRIFLVWTDASGTQRVLQSSRLFFVGSPATIKATPATDLPASRLVKVTGTAFGANGHTVKVHEAACYSIVQGSGCYGDYSAVSSRVRSDGTYSVSYRVHRYLIDGTDCASQDILGACELTVAVLDGARQADDSFGVSRRGQPAAWLQFRTS